VWRQAIPLPFYTRGGFAVARPRFHAAAECDPRATFSTEQAYRDHYRPVDPRVRDLAQPHPRVHRRHPGRRQPARRRLPHHPPRLHPPDAGRGGCVVRRGGGGADGRPRRDPRPRPLGRVRSPGEAGPRREAARARREHRHGRAAGRGAGGPRSVEASCGAGADERCTYAQDSLTRPRRAPAGRGRRSSTAARRRRSGTPSSSSPGKPTPPSKPASKRRNGTRPRRGGDHPHRGAAARHAQADRHPRDADGAAQGEHPGEA
jgi:hypothetical protein